MTTQDRITIGGFISLAALIVTLGGMMFARIDGVEERMTRLEEGQRELSERMARFEGALSAVVAIADLNPPPDAPEREAPR